MSSSGDDTEDTENPTVTLESNTDLSQTSFQETNESNDTDNDPVDVETDTDDVIIREGLDTESLDLGQLAGDTLQTVSAENLIGRWEGRRDTGELKWLVFNADGTLEVSATYASDVIDWELEGNLLLESYIRSAEGDDPYISRQFKGTTIAVVDDVLYKGDVFIRREGNGSDLGGTWMHHQVLFLHTVSDWRTLDELYQNEEQYTIDGGSFTFTYYSQWTDGGVLKESSEESSGSISTAGEYLFLNREPQQSWYIFPVTDNVFIRCLDLDEEKGRLEECISERTYYRVE